MEQDISHLNHLPPSVHILFAFTFTGNKPLFCILTKYLISHSSSYSEFPTCEIGNLIFIVYVHIMFLFLMLSLIFISVS